MANKNSTMNDLIKSYLRWFLKTNYWWKSKNQILLSLKTFFYWFIDSIFAVFNLNSFYLNSSKENWLQSYDIVTMVLQFVTNFDSKLFEKDISTLAWQFVWLLLVEAKISKETLRKQLFLMVAAELMGKKFHCSTSTKTILKNSTLLKWNSDRSKLGKIFHSRKNKYRWSFSITISTFQKIV